MEAVDRVMSDRMAHAEKRCRKIRAGEIPFSEKLVRAGNKIKVWRLVIRHKTTNNVNTRTIRRAAQVCNLSGVLAVSIHTARARLATAWKQYTRLKKTAGRLCDEFLDEREELATTETAQRAIQCIRRNEETRRSWRAVHRSHGKLHSKGISSVQVQRDGNWETLTDREQAEMAIMHNNTERFHLTTSTPLMSATMRGRLGCLAQGELAETILHGNYHPDVNLDPHTNAFLSYISLRSQLPPLSASVSLSDFQKYWKGSRERASSSLSGRHFGH